MRVVNMRSLGFLKRLQLAYSGFLFHVYCGDILRFLYRRAESSTTWASLEGKDRS
jgi:hypothetical protein